MNQCILSQDSCIYDQDYEKEKKSRQQKRRVPLRNKKEEEVGDNGNDFASKSMMMRRIMMIPERPKVRNLISLFRPVGSSIVSFSVSWMQFHFYLTFKLLFKLTFPDLATMAITGIHVKGIDI